ncbi:hypothetical protein ACFQS7_23890 [Dankookia sp. GCM10030260]|uniref:hypothetical protein n=1 Tax=Dankookia sp. GCM10030260 TaxID=3273390 RepID=UPI003605BF39
MAEQRASERTAERTSPERLMARPEADRNGELPSRTGGYDHMAAEAHRSAEAATQAATNAAAEEIGASVTRLVQETSRGLRAAMLLPASPGTGFGEMQEAFAAMVASMMRNNIRLAQEMLRIYSLQDNLVLMQRIMRHWSDAALQSQASMARMVQPPAEQVATWAEAAAQRPGTPAH